MPRYPGGKNLAGVYQLHINEIPPHELFVEAFFGSGAITRLKRPAAHTIGIDMAYQTRQYFPGDIAGTHIVGDGIAWLRDHQDRLGPDAFVYADPPYLHDTRVKLLLYDYELTREQHEDLLEACNALRCNVMLCGYPSRIYGEALRPPKWRTKSYRVITRGGTLRTERIWMNYPKPAELHDYQYLGRDYHDRERIKRRQRNWVRFLSGMPDLERAAMMAHLNDSFPGFAPGEERN